MILLGAECSEESRHTDFAFAKILQSYAKR
jgi:hypothetical protein